MMFSETTTTEAAALGALIGGIFGYFEQEVADPRSRHALKYAVIGSLGLAAFATLLRAEENEKILPPLHPGHPFGT